MKKRYLIILIVFLIAIFFILFNYYFGIITYYNYKPFSWRNYYSRINTKPIITTNLPKIDSSIALYPFSSTIIQNTYDKNSYNNELSYVSTFETFYNLAQGSVDAIIVTMPNSYHELILNSSSGDIKMIPVAKEALVFYTNSSNSVNSLSIEEIEDIYNGKIPNWSTLGGKDRNIMTFQLKKDVGGSEACFATIVRDNTIDEINHFISYDMRNIINCVSWNDYSIGYAFNSFFDKLYKKINLKPLAINGYLPNEENIVTGQYPLLFDVYYMYDANNTNENVIVLRDWLLSNEGQKTIKEFGLMPINKGDNL